MAHPRLLRIFYAIIFSVIAAGSFGGTYPCPEGAFILQLPEQWRTAVDPEEKFPVILGPEDDIDAPSIIVTFYPTPLELMVFADEALKDFSQMEGYALQKRDSFLTANGGHGLKAVASAKGEDGLYAQVFYFVEGDEEGHYVFVATMPEPRLPCYERKMDAFMKSFCPGGEAPTWTKQLNTPPSLRLEKESVNVKKESSRHSELSLPRPPRHRGGR